jgi:hypothetical protein
MVMWSPEKLVDVIPALDKFTVAQLYCVWDILFISSLGEDQILGCDYSLSIARHLIICFAI